MATTKPARQATSGKKRKRAKRSGALPVHAQEHLEASGLTLEDAKVLELEWLTPGEAVTALGLDRDSTLPCGGILWPYFDISGVRIADTLRVRMLPDPSDGWVPVGGEASNGRKPLPKYLQPPGTPPRVYFAKGFDWAAAAEDTSVDLLVTEGEKKAAAAVKVGLPTLGLGGVWSFGQRDMGVDFLPDLEHLRWQGRRVYIAYDSDARSNKDVRRAQLVLAQKLHARGAEVRALMIPGGTDGVKWGLDDLLVRRGLRAVREAMELAPAITPELEEMAEYYERFILVRTLSAAWDEKTHMLYPTRHKFFDAFPDEAVQTISPSGTPQHTTKAQLWWSDPKKQAANRLVLRPGEPRITEDGNLNTFAGWGTTPKRGSTAVWAMLLSSIFGGRRDLIRWFERWLAYPLQNPGAKLRQAVFVYSAAQGIGKSAIGYVMLDIYGPSGRVFEDDTLFGPYRGWLASTLFALCDDLSFEDRRKDRSKIKNLVSNDIVEVNEKYIPSYRGENHCNFYLTAQSAAALPLDPNGSNRRYLVVDGPEERTFPAKWFFTDFHRWRHMDGGPAAVHARLLDLDLGDYNPYEDAPMTDAKQLVVEASRTGAEAWCSDLYKYCEYEIYTAREVWEHYRATTQDYRTSLGTFTATLRHFATPLGQQRAPSGEGHISLWAVRNVSKWRTASAAERIECYQRERGQQSTRQRKRTKDPEVMAHRREREAKKRKAAAKKKAAARKAAAKKQAAAKRRAADKAAKILRKMAKKKQN